MNIFIIIFIFFLIYIYILFIIYKKLCSLKYPLKNRCRECCTMLEDDEDCGYRSAPIEVGCYQCCKYPCMFLCDIIFYFEKIGNCIFCCFIAAFVDEKIKEMKRNKNLTVEERIIKMIERSN